MEKSHHQGVSLVTLLGLLSALLLAGSLMVLTVAQAREQLAVRHDASERNLTTGDIPGPPPDPPDPPAPKSGDSGSFRGERAFK